ncbi:MAG: hypothetical protein QOI80_2718 [Solirubrobacteraceae bacterium]|nr:hypothetical protein [Solirubrobacteraceae bacterium]
MQSTLTQSVAREQAADRLRRARMRQQVSRTLHPPSRMRRRSATVVARLAQRLDADAARVAVRS